MFPQTREFQIESPRGYAIDGTLLEAFERGLDLRNPQASQIPCRVLGYGEISTVLEIQVKHLHGLAFKRMSVFETQEELVGYFANYQEYNQRLENEIGIHLPPHGYATITRRDGRPIFYIIQEQLSPGSIANQALQRLSPAVAALLLNLVLNELYKVWKYNLEHPTCPLAIDGQISNWSIVDFNADEPHLDGRTALLYIDTSSPMFKREGVEQSNPELFVRSAPPYLAWILRVAFLPDVMSRYYNPRKVIIDLIANFYKEQRAELIPAMVAAANDFIHGEAADLAIQAIDTAEVASYYREDKLIWVSYLAMRRFDRFVRQKLFHREYPYILPGRIKR